MGFDPAGVCKVSRDSGVQSLKFGPHLSRKHTHTACLSLRTWRSIRTRAGSLHNKRNQKKTIFQMCRKMLWQFKPPCALSISVVPTRPEAQKQRAVPSPQNRAFCHQACTNDGRLIEQLRHPTCYGDPPNPQTRDPHGDLHGSNRFWTKICRFKWNMSVALCCVVLWLGWETSKLLIIKIWSAELGQGAGNCVWINAKTSGGSEAEKRTCCLGPLWDGSETRPTRIFDRKWGKDGQTAKHQTYQTYQTYKTSIKSTQIH